MSKEEKSMDSLILQGIKRAQRSMLERKAKLGESVVYADDHGVPYIIRAEDALKLLDESGNKL